MFKRINIDKKTEKRISMPGVLMPWILMFAVIGLIAAGIFSYTHIWKDSANKGTMLDFVRIDNGEVLDLTWKLQKKYQNDGNDYSYKILLYDSEQKPKIELTVNPSKDSTLWTCPAVIYDYRESSVTTKTMNLTFVASMDKNGQMHLILDAVDDEAGEILSEAYMAALTEGADAATEIWTEAVAENEAGAAAENATEAAAEIGTEAVSDSAGITVSLGADALNETYSAMRFWLLSGLDLTDDIYAKIAVVDTSGICGQWLETDTVQFLMADDSDIKMQTYKVNNARHLYNVRFMEVLTADSEAAVTYEQTADITWSGDDSIVSRGHVYHSDSDWNGFLPIPYLSDHSVLISHDYAIVHLTIYVQSEDALLGLVSVNNGKISGLKLEGISVSGNLDVSAKASGAVCAVNNGILENNRVIEGSVSGADYVGGIVGCMMPGAQMNGCVFEGGSVSGENFIGGLIGINHSSAILNSEVLAASPQLVDGANFVGGLIGGNMVLVNESQKQMTLNVSINSENGTVHGEGAFVGGVLGFNALFREFDEDAAGVFFADELLAAIDSDQSLADADNAEVSSDADNAAASDTVNSADIIDADNAQAVGKVADVSWKLVITAPEELLDSYGNVTLDSVEGQIYVGGVIGYQEEHSRLEITGIRSKADIYAASSVETEDGSASYAGGIMGLVPETAIISHCTVFKEAQIVHQGMYRGSIAEINKGWIVQCEANEYGDADAENIGGIVGVNAQNGRISACRLTGTLTGKSNVGGMASLNQGLIIACVIDGDVEGHGCNIGGIAGKNTGTIRDIDANKSVRGGSCVGGIVGYNTGSVIDCSVENSGIHGNCYVGGFVGCQADNDSDGDDSGSNAVVRGLYNVTEVYANKHAGGIIGFSDGKVTITDCGNDAIIYSDDGYVGGITAYNGESSVIKQCSVTARVEAPKAYSIGSVCGVNAGHIEQCKVEGGFKLTGSSHVGGIAGINFGDINLSTIAQVDVALQGGTKDCSVGGVVGSNLGTIAISGSPVLTSTGTPKAVNVTSNTDGSYVGGVAGYNAGVINGMLPAEVKTTMLAQVVTKNEASAYVGGIAGKNTGEITGYIFAGYVETTGYEGFGTGGIAGVNGSDGNNVLSDDLLLFKESIGIVRDLSASKKTLITQCEVSDLRLNNVTLNNKNNSDTSKYTVYTTNNENVCTGGIVGFNCSDGQISNAIPVICYIRGDYGYTGGIAGLNHGNIESCMASDVQSADDEKINVKIYMKDGSVGGIAGMNGMGGSISMCSTGHDWLILQESQSTKSAQNAVNAAGGIIGCNSAIRSIYNVENNAAVKKTDSNDHGVIGGVVGIQKCMASSSWKLMQCINNGDVTGGNNAGAIIGQWLMLGGSVVQCENNGTVSAADSSAGMIGSISQLTSGTTASIEACVNLGAIEAQDGAGGIVGSVEDNGLGSEIVITACSNAGAVDAQTLNMGGIVGGFLGNGASVYIHQCVNYYRPQSKDFNGIAINHINSEVTLCMNIPSSTTQSSSMVFNDIGSNRRLGYDCLNFSLGIFDVADLAVINQGDSIPLIVQFKDGHYQAANAEIETVLENLPYNPNSANNRTKSAQKYYEDLHEIVEEFLANVHNANEKLHTMD